MALMVTLIFMVTLTMLALGSLENAWLNQKMADERQASIIAFNGAEAGIRAAEAEINGKAIDLTDFKSSINFQITADSVDECQHHIFTINSLASYQGARVKIESSYLQAHQPSLPECTVNISHQLWWRQIDI